MGEVFESADLEYGGGSRIKQIGIVCPHCLVGRYVSKNWFAGICGGCGKYFNKENALPLDKANSMLNNDPLIDKERNKIIDASKQRAENWSKWAKKTGRLGKSHEPDKAKRSF